MIFNVLTATAAGELSLSFPRGESKVPGGILADGEPGLCQHSEMNAD